MKHWRRRVLSQHYKVIQASNKPTKATNVCQKKKKKETFFVLPTSPLFSLSSMDVWEAEENNKQTEDLKTNHASHFGPEHGRVRGRRLPLNAGPKLVQDALLGRNAGGSQRK